VQDQTVRGLYAIIDVEATARRGLEPARFAEALLAAGPAALQLRDKRGNAHDTLELLRNVKEKAERAGVPLYANDRPDLALLAGAHGVHLGQDDLPPSAARKLAGGAELSIGMSVHDERELARAIDEGVDYLALGAVFSASSKAGGAPLLGLSGLDALIARARLSGARPIVGIGGITLERAAEVGTRCDAVAVIGALLPPDDAEDPYAWVSARAAALHQAVLSAC
jgi:thiamine-phosphate pyrophosphorylase